MRHGWGYAGLTMLGWDSSVLEFEWDTPAMAPESCHPSFKNHPWSEHHVPSSLGLRGGGPIPMPALPAGAQSP